MQGRKENEPRRSNQERVESGLLPEHQPRKPEKSESEKAQENLKSAEAILLESASTIYYYLQNGENIVEEDFPFINGKWRQRGTKFEGGLSYYKKRECINFRMDVNLEGECIVINLQKDGEAVVHIYAISLAKEKIVKRPANQPVADMVLANEVQKLAAALEGDDWSKLL